MVETQKNPLQNISLFKHLHSGLNDSLLKLDVLI
jgi:hypothetical protein